MLPWWVFGGAGLLDMAVGDPEPWPHPVRLIGRVISALDKARRGITDPLHLKWLGVGLAVGVPLLTALVAWVACALFGRWQWIPQLVLGAWMLAGRSLQDAVRPLLKALQNEDLPAARLCLAKVVGRDTAHLEEEDLVRGGLEALAESLCDGVVAPLFWFALGGLPGLWAYKAVNTLDSMVGHREAPWTHFGWASARLDDLLNWLPARLTALLIALAAWSKEALEMARRDGHKTDSPNAGVTEAAFAGALDVQLGGTNDYDGIPKAGPLLGDPGTALSPAVLEEGLTLAAKVNRWAILLGTVGLMLAAYLCRVWQLI